MNKPQFISRLVSQPWDMDKLRARSVIGALVTRLQAERPAADQWGDPLPRMQLVGNVALIPITGVMTIDVPDSIKEYGLNLTDANDIAGEIEDALADENIELLVFDVDSPGGLSLAGNKLFELVEAANRKKPCFGFCGDGREMCSAAYNAVAGATALYSGRYAAAIGCIGSYLVMLDDTEFWKQMGITFEVFRSGELKGLGVDPLSEAQRAFLQSMVDESGARIRKNVAKYRTEIAPEDLQGQYYEGLQAAARGWVAGNVKDLNAAIAKFRRL